MPNFAASLKAEITRLSRKELRDETKSLKKAVAAYRSEIAALKRRTTDLERLVKRLAKGRSKAATSSSEKTEPTKLRFNAKGFAVHRQKLGLSAEDSGRLLGVSGQSIYKWEAGKAKPQARQLPAIAVYRKLGKRAARAELARLAGE
jgi:DNA-binding transcriptional regulator YiaG